MSCGDESRQVVNDDGLFEVEIQQANKEKMSKKRGKATVTLPVHEEDYVASYFFEVEGLSSPTDVDDPAWGASAMHTSNEDTSESYEDDFEAENDIEGNLELKQSDSSSDGM
ncbi:hypothetical protein PanWU01x14_213810, partial [Parasponia andersonii]